MQPGDQVFWNMQEMLSKNHESHRRRTAIKGKQPWCRKPPPAFKLSASFIGCPSVNPGLLQDARIPIWKLMSSEMKLFWKPKINQKIRPAAESK